MKRPWQVWLVFGVCVVGAAAALAFLTRQALEANRLRQEAQANAELEQRVSLALWRMDSELAPLVAAEIVRPPAAYRVANWVPNFSAPSAPLQQTENLDSPPMSLPPLPLPAANSPTDAPQQQQAEMQQQSAPQMQQAVQMPAPNQPAVGDDAARGFGDATRTVAPPPYVLLQFEARPDGSWVSPQSPRPVESGSQQDQTPLAKLSHDVDLQQLLARLPSTPIPSMVAVGDNFSAANAAKSPEQYNTLAQQLNFYEGNRGQVANDSPPESKPISKGKAAEFQQRGQRYQTAAQQSLLNQQRGFRQTEQSTLFEPPEFAQQQAFGPFDQGQGPMEDEQVGVTRPMWIDDQLVLARRVGFNGETAVQGSVLDWPLLKTRLLAEATDLPDADLVPVRDNTPVDPGRMLAGLPVRLVVGPATIAADANSTLGWSLGMAWGGIALATIAAAALLAGVMTLSERRAAFVSSVTHELRTPLTTFRMYSEMLARNMVPDAARRQEYLHTLQREAERLTLLVDNVLSYARLERGRKPSAVDHITVGKLFERVGPRLSHRASQADMECVFEIAPDVEPCELTTDQNVVEQILFNLVDNAAKYARQAADKRIHVAANRDANWVRLAVRDHGPGIEQSRWSGKMRAFGKSAEQSAETAPGVGLGLALCRRLAKQLGGRLEVAESDGGGAEVRLMLPA